MDNACFRFNTGDTQLTTRSDIDRCDVARTVHSFNFIPAFLKSNAALALELDLSPPTLSFLPYL